MPIGPRPSAQANRDRFQNWSRMEPAKASAKLYDMLLKHERNLGWRHRMAQRGALAFSGACPDLGELFDGLMFSDRPYGSKRSRKRKHSGFRNRDSEQHARAMVETVVEKLFGMDEPKCQLVATDAEWEVQRQGVWADRFVDGSYHLSQGTHNDFWELARQAGLLAFCATGTVAIRIEPDFVNKRVRSQLRSTLNTFIDPADRGFDAPLSYFDVTWEHPEYLCEDERFKGKEDTIWAAARVPERYEGNYEGGAAFDTPMVKVLTAWRRPFGDFKGRHAVCVFGEMGGYDEPIWWDDWKHQETPLVFYRCNPSIYDPFWGENMIEVALTPLQDAEDIDDLAKRTMELTSQTYVHLDGDSTAPSDLMNAKDVKVLRYKSTKGEKPTVIEKPGILNGDYFDWQMRKIAVAHELTGVSLMHQAGEVQGGTGARSGRSIRLEASLLPERFARKLRGWRNFVAAHCGKATVRAAKAIGEVVPDWQVTWSGPDYAAKVKVDVLDIDLQAYTIQAYAVSEQKNTPADRADAAQEMYDRGEISAQQLEAILEGLYDTKRETKASTAQRRYGAKVADGILYGDESTIADENRWLSEEYDPPVPWMDAEGLLAQLAPVYTDAMIDGVPQNRRTLLRRFLEDIWELRMQQQREAAMAEASVNLAGQLDPMMAGGPQMPLLGGPNAPIAAPAPAIGAPVGEGLPAPMPAGGIPAAPPGGALVNAPGAPGLV